jgi:hypothetical protein
LERHTAKRANGLWTISATYVGAKYLSGNFSGLINRDAEARVTPPKAFPAGFVFSDDDPPQPITVFDVISVKFVAQTVTRSVAGANSGAFDLELLGGNADSYIYRVEYGVISRATPDTRTLLTYASPRSILRQFKPVLTTSTKLDNVTNVVVIATTVQTVVFEKPEGDG